jgi:hypothetical protein|tara:strand:- start:737 stop:973 length:237 start_codon:yes stop_codon:yes gene_type:complete
MCINLNRDETCKLKSSLPDGSRYSPEIAVAINTTFKNLAEERDVENKSKMGYACGGPGCCYVYNDLVTLEDCPYFNVS